jgi:uncharacterized protein (DUF1499 family)
VSTDTKSPPAFAALAGLRTGTANAPAYPGPRFATSQAEAYPDLRTYTIARGAEEAFDLMLDVLKRQLKMQVVAEEPPRNRQEQPGRIEAIDRTLVLGFYDDVVIRIDGDQSRSRIDVRSASRYGTHDLGQNAQRVRLILKGLQARLEQTLPSSDLLSRRRWRPDRVAVPRRGKDGSPESTAARSQQDRARSDSQRGPVPKAQPRVRDERQGRDKRRPQFE